MIRQISEDDAIATVPYLTPRRLTAFIEAEIITPVQTLSGPVFHDIDIARIELLCELCEDFNLDEDALGIVISLIDQLHDARRDLRAIAAAVSAEPQDVRARIGAALSEARKTSRSDQAGDPRS